jgi:hypothetical protein
MSQFDDIAVGDLVVFRRSHLGRFRRILKAVTNVTPTQFTVECGTRIMRTSGRVVGASGWSYTSVFKATPDDIASIKAERRLELRRDAFSLLLNRVGNTMGEQVDHVIEELRSGRTPGTDMPARIAAAHRHLEAALDALTADPANQEPQS